MSDDKDKTKVDAGEQVKNLLSMIHEQMRAAATAAECIEEFVNEALALVGDIQRGRPRTRRERILVSLASETRTQSYLADDTGIPYSVVVAELALLVADCQAEKVGKGAFRAVGA